MTDKSEIKSSPAKRARDKQDSTSNSGESLPRSAELRLQDGLQPATVNAELGNAVAVASGMSLFFAFDRAEAVVLLDSANDNMTYSLGDDVEGRFTIDADRSAIALSDNFEYGIESKHAIEAKATSSDGSVATRNLLIEVNSDNEIAVSVIPEGIGSVDTSLGVTPDLVPHDGCRRDRPGGGGELRHRGHGIGWRCYQQHCYLFTLR